MKKKFQVFVSSTYTDMLAERQGAIEAILEAGHIPAGMELFTADNKQQFEVIKKWIKDCDVFILILGGRYGSVEKGKTKSYIQREYEYAKHIGKKPIAILLSEDGYRKKISQKDYPVSNSEYESTEYKNFRKKIENTKMCSFFDDVASLKLCIAHVLNKLQNENKLTGWIKANLHDDSINSMSWAYEFVDQEYTFKYVSLTDIEYTKIIRIRALVDGLEYISDRYAWNAGGKLIKSLQNPNQKIVDEYTEGRYTVYTIKLDEVSQKGKEYTIAIKYTISNSSYCESQHLGYELTLPARNLTLTVEAAPGLNLTDCRYNIYEHSADRVATKTDTIIPNKNRATHVFKNIVAGKRYNIEWKIG